MYVVPVPDDDWVMFGSGDWSLIKYSLRGAWKVLPHRVEGELLNPSCLLEYHTNHTHTAKVSPSKTHHSTADAIRSLMYQQK